MIEYSYKENGVMKLKPVALSLSQSEIDEIATELLEAMQPDWQNAETITAAQINAGYTVPADGMIVGYMTTAVANSHQDVTINGVLIATAYYYNSSGGGDSSFASIQVVVKKGDLLKSTNIYANDTKCGFVPFKTSNPVSLRPLDPHKIDTAILNHWDDITSDFSTAGSTSGITLNYVKYNPVLRMLKYKVTRNQSTAANSTEKHELIYNGSEMIAFSANSTILIESINFISSSITGYEVSSKIISSNHIETSVYNSNVNSSWESGHYFTGVIYL